MENDLQKKLDDERALRNRLFEMLERITDLYAKKLAEKYDPETILHGQVGRARELMREVKEHDSL